MKNAFRQWSYTEFRFLSLVSEHLKKQTENIKPTTHGSDNETEAVTRIAVY